MVLVELPLAFATTVSASATLIAGRHNPVDASGGTVGVTLPVPQNVGARLIVEKVDASTNFVNFTGSIRGATQTLSLVKQNESQSLFWTGATWRPLSARVGPNITVGTVAPPNPAVNDIWIDTN